MKSETISLLCGPGTHEPLRLYVTYPAARQSLKDIFSTPLEVTQQMGYGLFAGRK
jgi:hypothetical protein